MAKRILEVQATAQRDFDVATGEPALPKGEHALAVLLAGIVKQLVGSSHGNTRVSTVVTSTEAIKQIVEEGAWLELEQEGEELVITVTLK